MARPPRFDTPQLLDAAVRLAAESGPSGVTMSAVAAAVGAPSGSLYHRFPGRSALLAEVWLRTVEGFQEGYFEALESSDDPRTGARAAARHIVAWSRAHPQEAALLLYGSHDFGHDDWPDEQLLRAEDGNMRVRAAVAALAGALGIHGRPGLDRVTLAVIDLPLSLVRRHLRGGSPLPAHAEDLAEQCTGALLADD
ncbi:MULTISPECIES: TetR/AcrR family transcriptional regulator [unclassified Streptomyces]|uniref:TetR/AcrR family transcriptional regulator n=1 Tax=Streptomyces TaxID=1883 RepID=UPI00089A7440|nr:MULTISPECIES: TetR/AcrR family transcriptional regulator [unclassified Streptomyces]PJJ01070.1 TetR family transcriptional regulator [Streptomyces sp. 2333.5]TXC95097.1 TetR/AcrR family transcriptional regulator [Streptomyces sp. ISID311]SEC36350.1 transcriptional regulator, TetR family [Streptomyces sp. 2314.4]SED18441.1 transcriptional regulator, TetR family [Streptomyces sp. 2112.2]SOE14690.1 transcriptional regulator, TetR family [Streptomyces sp. 2323.1]